MANLRRLIDLDKIKPICFPSTEMDGLDVVRYLNTLPTVDAVEVVHGYWDDTGRYQFPSGKKAIRCNICGCALSEGEYHFFNWNYCPVCGAKMDGVSDG